MSAERRFDEVKEWLRADQVGGAPVPNEWLLGEMMSRGFDVCPLRYGGDDYGFMFWMKIQDGVPKGIRGLKRTAEEHDAVTGRLVEAERLLGEARAELERQRGARAAVAVPVAVAAPVGEREREAERAAVSVAAPEPAPAGASAGERAYRARAAGKAWGECGVPNGLQVAKKWARKTDADWPPPERRGGGRGKGIGLAGRGCR